MQGTDDSVSRDVRHPRLGQNPRRSEREGGRIKNAINSMNAAQFREQPAQHLEELFFRHGRAGHGDVTSIASSTRNIVSSRTCSRHQHLHRPPCRRGGDLRWPGQQLVGIETFSGSTDNKSPQHASCSACPGAGKSVTVCDLLTQTEGYFGYTVIIEEDLELRHLHRDRRGGRGQSSSTRTAT